MIPSSRLSICIPTYNRAQCLEECLDSVLVAGAGHWDRVEIVIADNASTDDTAGVVARFQARLPQIRYHRHATNIGGENNFYAVVEMATGEYIWLLSDDDKFLPQAIATALACLEQGYDFLITNYSVWTHDFAAVKLQSMMPLRTDRVFEDPNRLLASLGAQVSFISAVAIRRSYFLAPSRQEYDAFAKFGMAFLYVFYASVASHCHGLYLARPLVCNRDNPRGWSGEIWEQFFIVGTQAVFARLVELGYSRAAVHAAKDRLLRDYVLRTLLGRVRDGQAVWPLLRRMEPDFGGHWFFWLACVPTALIPPPLLKWATQVVRWRRARQQSGIELGQTQ